MQEILNKLGLQAVNAGTWYGGESSEDTTADIDRVRESGDGGFDRVGALDDPRRVRIAHREGAGVFSQVAHDTGARCAAMPCA